VNQQLVTSLRSEYPFDRWAKNGRDFGMEQYTDEACAAFAAVFDHLLEKLVALGEAAPEPAKLAAFKEAVEALNALNEEDSSLIETGEREDLCELCNKIATAAGMDPEKYGGGEGPASEWRDW
jgi:hypothetical protein